MEKNTVILDLPEFVELIRFRNEIKSGKKLVIQEDWGVGMISSGNSTEYFTDDEALKDVVEKYQNLEKESVNLRKRNRKLYHTIYNMNLWQFLKFKFSNYTDVTKFLSKD